MSETPRPPGPPHHPHLRELIARKRQWSSDIQPDDQRQGFRGWSERGYLPHRDEPGLTQFVTFRLTDSFPEHLRDQWQHLWSIEDTKQRRAELESYLDRGLGDCHLRSRAIASLVEDTLRYFHGQRYELRAWAVMPNHVHALFHVTATPMAKIIESWKKHSAQKANQFLNRHGPFWQPDYWDTFMRDEEHELNSRQYIERNPVKAGLTATPKDWPFSSARFRDDSGKLTL